MLEYHQRLGFGGVELVKGEKFGHRPKGARATLTGCNFAFGALKKDDLAFSMDLEQMLRDRLKEALECWV